MIRYTPVFDFTRYGVRIRDLPITINQRPSDQFHALRNFCSSNFKGFLFLNLIGVVLAFLISILKISKWLQNCWHRDIDITSFEKLFGKFVRSYSELLSNFGDILFQEYVSKGISYPVFYGDLVCKLRKVRDTPNFISSGSKIEKRLRRRQHDALIIERTIGFVFGSSSALYRLKELHSD